jgi:hypothetical protein
MNAHRVEATIEHDGELTLTDLPFRAGAAVEVIILTRAAESNGQKRYPLRGQPIQFDDPTAPVAQDDWEAAR